MIDFILKLALATFETILLVLFLEMLLNRDYDKIMQKRFLYFAYFIFQMITYFIDFTFFSTCIYYILFALLIACYCYLDEIRIKLIASSMFVTLNYACKLLSITIHASYYKLNLPSNPFEYILTNQMQALACTMLLLVIMIIIIMRNLKNEISRIIVNITIFILPLLNLYISMDLLSERNNIYLEITSLLFCYIFFLFFIIDQIIYTSKAELASNIMHKRLEYQKLYYSDLQDYTNKMSRLKHDIKNHQNTLYYLISNDKIKEAKKYIENLNNEYIAVQSVINTGNDVFDVVLNYKTNVAKKKNIEVNTKIVIPPSIEVSSVEISVILGNLLDNAIEACEKIQNNRKIDIKIKTYKSNLFINISNSYNGFLIMEDNNFVSSKKNVKEHGIGIFNIKHIIKKYKGTIDFVHDDGTFTVSILLPNVIKEFN